MEFKFPRPEFPSPPISNCDYDFKYSLDNTFDCQINEFYLFSDLENIQVLDTIEFVLPKNIQEYYKLLSWNLGINKDSQEEWILNSTRLMVARIPELLGDLYSRFVQSIDCQDNGVYACLLYNILISSEYSREWSLELGRQMRATFTE